MKTRKRPFGLAACTSRTPLNGRAGRHAAVRRQRARLDDGGSAHGLEKFFELESGLDLHSLSRFSRLDSAAILFVLHSMDSMLWGKIVSWHSIEIIQINRKILNGFLMKQNQVG